MARCPLGFSLSLIAAALAAGGCDSSAPLAPDPSAGVAVTFIVSDAARPGTGATGAVGGLLAANLGSSGAVAWVSAAPGTAEGAASVEITNLRLQETRPAAILDGGFDPVPVPAQEGDSVEVRFGFASGATLAVRAAVPARRPPRVVRTHPARGRRDVALNAIIGVVFSEPVNPATVSDSTVRLFRDGVAVRGTVRPAAGTNVGIEFAPADPLAPATTYRFLLDSRIRDLAGDPLEATEPVEFTTFGTAGTGTLTVTTRASGTDIPAGFELVLDGQPVGAIGPAETVVIPGVGFGGHHLLLGGMTEYCYAHGGLYRQVSVTPGSSPSVAYEIVCTDLPELELNVSTSGIDLDSDGYEVQVNGVSVGTVPPTGSLSLTGLHYGVNVVLLSGMRGNCAAAGSARQVLDLRPGDAGTLDIAVTCTPDFAPTGTIAFTTYAEGGTVIAVADADGSNRRHVTQPNRSWQDRSPAWSPDGTRIAFLRSGAYSGLYVMNADGTNILRLVDESSGALQSPAWSHDGREIAFSRSGPVDDGLLAVAPDGLHAPRMIRPDLWNEFAWSPVRGEIAYVWGPELRIIDAGGTFLREISFDLAEYRFWITTDPVWSPDGRELAMVICRTAMSDGECGDRSLDIVPAAGGAARRMIPLADLIARPAWSPDGSTFAYTDCSGCSPIRYMRTDGQGSTVEISDGFDPAWKPSPAP